MGLIYNGSMPKKIIYNGAEVSLYFNGVKVWPDTIPPSDYVTIGSQTWMSKNLTINDGLGGIYTQVVDYGQGEVIEYYYTWEAAIRIASTIEGWHLPSIAEWNTLFNTVGGDIIGSHLKSRYGWSSGNGLNTYNFNVFPAGRWYSTSSVFFEKFKKAYFWTSNSSTETDATGIVFTTDSSVSSSVLIKADGFSVRLIKD